MILNVSYSRYFKSENNIIQRFRSFKCFTYLYIIHYCSNHT